MKKIASISSVLIAYLLSGNPVLAQILVGPTIVISPPAGAAIDIGKILSATISLIFIIAGLAAFIFLIWGGIQWITSGGDKSGVESAQHRIQAALLGLFIVFAAYAIMSVAQTFFGVCLGINGCTITIRPINQ